jgi:hypothetical protein
MANLDASIEGKLRMTPLIVQIIDRRNSGDFTH